MRAIQSSNRRANNKGRQHKVSNPLHRNGERQPPPAGCPAGRELPAALLAAHSRARSRIGKIARLPRDLRHQLNQRLADGESGPRILKWLNGLPEVVEMLGKEFGGRPVNAQNLSDWRQGGYQDWWQHEEELAEVAELEHVILNFCEFDWRSTMEFLGEWGAFHYTRLLRRFRPSGDEAADLERLRTLMREVLEFQRGQAEVRNATLPIRQHEDAVEQERFRARVDSMRPDFGSLVLEAQRASRQPKAVPGGADASGCRARSDQADSGSIKADQGESR